MAEKQEHNLSLGENERVGDYLRRIREVRGLDLEHLAKSIRLGKNILQAIEDNNWSFFPTEAYLRSYIVSLCDKLSLDKNIVLDKFSVEINSQFRVTQTNVVGELSQKKEPPQSNISKVAIVIIMVIIAILFFANKLLKKNFEEEDEPAPTMHLEEELESQEESASDSLVKNDSVAVEAKAAEVTAKAAETAKATEAAKAAETAEAAKAAKAAEVAKAAEAAKAAAEAAKAAKAAEAIAASTSDTLALRFECVPSPTDNTCGVSLKGTDLKMNYFVRMTSRYIKRSDTAQVTITVPDRTRLFVNNIKLEYGKYNTLIFYNGSIIDKVNRELR
jgi:cytoskeletal protein RodZ